MTFFNISLFHVITLTLKVNKLIPKESIIRLHCAMEQFTENGVMFEDEQISLFICLFAI